MQNTWLPPGKTSQVTQARNIPAMNDLDHQVDIDDLLTLFRHVFVYDRGTDAVLAHPLYFWYFCLRGRLLN